VKRVFATGSSRDFAGELGSKNKNGTLISQSAA
jgi:hypothetical protein